MLDRLNSRQSEHRNNNKAYGEILYYEVIERIIFYMLLSGLTVGEALSAAPKESEVRSFFCLGWLRKLDVGSIYNVSMQFVSSAITSSCDYNHSCQDFAVEESSLLESLPTGLQKGASTKLSENDVRTSITS